MTRIERLCRGLDLAITAGIVRSYYYQSAMPGRRWIVEDASGTFTERAFTTSEAEAFVLGTTAAFGTAWKPRPCDCELPA